MIVDEAHNAVTSLTREMQARVNPGAIIEFTAAPRLKSNILHSVSAQELKLEEMVKLPIMLAEHDSWQNAVNGAIAGRAALAESAKDDPDYIRPIVLFQAQPKDQEVTVEVLKKHLMEVEQISEKKIAIATGDQRELNGIDLFDKACPIEYVITVEALKEGWDCSFAYVFCSVSRIQSAVKVEQLLGRVLRMPYAKRRKAPELNKAYAFLSEPSFGEAARALADTLVAMGFEEDEALDNIEPAQKELGEDGWLFAPRDKPKPIFTHTVTATPTVLSTLKDSGITARETDDGAVEIAVTGRIDGSLEKAILETLPETERTGFAEAVAKYRAEVRDQLSPAELGGSFVVPRLVSRIQGAFEFADTDVFMEFHDWSLLDHSAKIDEREFTIRETALTFEIDLDGSHVSYRFASEEEQLVLDVKVDGWTAEALTLWLDRQARQPDIHQSELLRWLRDMIGHLLGARGISIAALMRCKFILARRVREKIAAIRQQQRGKVYQQYLFAPEAKVDVSFDDDFAFKDGMYWDQNRYRGRWKWSIVCCGIQRRTHRRRAGYQRETDHRPTLREPEQRQGTVHRCRERGRWTGHANAVDGEDWSVMRDSRAVYLPDLDFPGGSGERACSLCTKDVLMTGSGMRTFTDEFKREAVRLVRTSGRTIGQIADDLGIGHSTLGKWLSRHREAELLAGPHDDTAKGLAR